MKLWKRRTALVLALLVFFIIAPIIILYATGYRYNLNKNDVGKVGMIIIESEPRDLNVLLNDEEIAKNTPHRIRNLTPRDYNVKLQKDGYQTWEKNLAVESSLVTWVSHARTFYQEPIQDIIFGATGIKDIIISENEKKAAFIVSDITSDILKTISIKEKETITIFPNLNIESYSPKIFEIINNAQYTISDIEWSNDNEKIFFILNKEGIPYYFIANTKESNNLILLNDLNIANLTWDKLDSNFVYYLSDGDLIKININDQTIKTIIAKKVSNFTLAGNDIFYSKELSNNDNQVVTTIINKINKNQKEESLEQISNIATFSGINFVYKSNDNGKLLALSGNKNLYLIDDKSVIKINNDVTNFDWADNDKNFLYYNEDTIWHYKIENDSSIYHPQYLLNKEDVLATGLSNIAYASWYPDEEHIMFVANNNIFIKELDSRGQANTFGIASDISNTNVYLDKDGENIFTIVNDNGLDNFTRLEIF